MVRDGVTGLPRVLFAAYLAATAAHIGLVMAHEPFAFDAWSVALETDAEPFSWLVAPRDRHRDHDQPEHRRTKLSYVPWTRGAYWALACHPTECFVIAAARVR